MHTLLSHQPHPLLPSTTALPNAANILSIPSPLNSSITSSAALGSAFNSIGVLSGLSGINGLTGLQTINNSVGLGLGMSSYILQPNRSPSQLLLPVGLSNRNDSHKDNNNTLNPTHIGTNPSTDVISSDNNNASNDNHYTRSSRRY